MLQELTDPVRRSEYGHLLADLTGVSEDSVRTALERRLGGHPEQVAKTLKRLSARDRVEREMLRLLVRDRAIFDEYAPQLSDEHVRTPAGVRRSRGCASTPATLGRWPAPTTRRSRRRPAPSRSSRSKGEPTREYAAHVFARLQEFVLKAKSDELRIRLQKLNPQTESGYDELFHELVAVDGDLRRIRQGLLDAG